MSTSIVFFCLIFILVTTVIIISLVIIKDVFEKDQVNIKFVPNNNFIYNASTGKLLLKPNIIDHATNNIILDKVLILKDLYLSLIIIVRRYNYVITNDIINLINSTQDKYKLYLNEIDLEDNSISLIVKYEIVMYRSIHLYLKEKFNNFSNENYDPRKVKNFLIKDLSSFIIKQDTLEDNINSIKNITSIMFYFYIIKEYTNMTINIDMLDKYCRFIRQNIYYSWTGYIEDNAKELILLHNLIVPNKDYILSKEIFNSYNTNFIYVPIKYELVFGNNTNDGIYFNKHMSSLKYSFDNILIFCMYANNNNKLKTHIDFNNKTSYLAKKIFNNDRLLSDQIFKNDKNMNIGSFVYEYNKNIFLIGYCFETSSYLVTVINKNGIIVIRDYNIKNDISYNLYVEYILNKYDNFPYFIKSKNTIEEYYEKKSIFDIKKISLTPIITKSNNKLFDSFIGFDNKQVINYLYDNENKNFTIDDISFSLNPNLSSFSNITPKDVKLVKVCLKDKDLYYDISISDNNKLVSMDNYKSEIDKNGCNFVLYPKIL